MPSRMGRRRVIRTVETSINEEGSERCVNCCDNPNQTFLRSSIGIVLEHIFERWPTTK